MSRALPLRRARLAGVTLVELLVAVVIGLIVTLAVTSMVTVGEAHKRSTTSTNDMGQTGAFAIYQLDRAVRSAGSGLVQSANQGVFGCKLNVASILPRTAAFPAPFASVLTGATATLRLAPLLIAKSASSAGSDVLVAMRANGSSGAVPRQVTDAGTTTTLFAGATVGMSAGDLLLLSQNGQSECLMEQIASIEASPSNQINLGGTFYTAASSTDASVTAATLTDRYVTPLGSATADSMQYQLFGVGDDRTLFSYDLLRRSGDTPQAVADGVSEMHALYGLDTNSDGVLDSWVDPSTATGYDIASVMANPTKIREIVAVHIALVLRTSTQEKDLVAPTTLTFFSDKTNAAAVSLERSMTLATTDRYYRHRIVESTIPLHNMQLAPGVL